MDFKPAITLLGKFAICLLAIFVALLTSNLALFEGGIYAIAGALNGAAWIVKNESSLISTTITGAVTFTDPFDTPLTKSAIKTAP